MSGRENIVPSGGGEGPAMLGTMAGQLPLRPHLLEVPQGAQEASMWRWRGCQGEEQCEGRGVGLRPPPPGTSPDLCNYLCLWH